jgi:hypothetical protein
LAELTWLELECPLVEPADAISVVFFAELDRQASFPRGHETDKEPRMGRGTWQDSETGS